MKDFFLKKYLKIDLYRFKHNHIFSHVKISEKKRFKK